ncbi:acylneuraminate cytidylyltransferase [Aeromicrobium endophyticum]|uniref:N-acylneuraminate cytidylyltransferase n=1 Tax=Aeromicrobium endophyticum TaxID=2292704 RepID=A0A371P410_9ACTN|nr:acylneuraminate cytidylyltransferase [Aeromicrobium endophyticum]REK70671.1 acylneuraminate cytidylyltransferase [Aeromicrobium endophyticum]
MVHDQVCAVIPARGGSKGVHRKNLRPLGGEPLVARAVRTLSDASSIGSVVVSTDDPQIAVVASRSGARVVERPAGLSGDEASSESAVEHALAHLASLGIEPEVTVFVQATSPFIRPADVDRAVALVLTGECDVAFSAAPADVHLWRHGVDGPEGVNHDAAVRLRRQDRDREHVETGAFYAMRTSGFLAHGHRFFGRLRIVEVAPDDALEIDTEHDLALAELLHAGRETASEARLCPIPARAVVTDFDGVHTADRVVVDEHGVESVEVNRSDGMGVARLRRAGIPFLILSSETNPVVEARAAKLGVEAVTGCHDKLSALCGWARRHGIDVADIAFLGNDVNDLACLRAVGWPVVVAGAHRDVHVASPIVLRRHGGDGAVRELADRVLAGHEERPSDGRATTTEGQ